MSTELDPRSELHRIVRQLKLELEWAARVGVVPAVAAPPPLPETPPALAPLPPEAGRPAPAEPESTGAKEVDDEPPPAFEPDPVDDPDEPPAAPLVPPQAARRRPPTRRDRPWEQYYDDETPPGPGTPPPGPGPSAPVEVAPVEVAPGGRAAGGPVAPGGRAAGGPGAPPPAAPPGSSPPPSRASAARPSPGAGAPAARPTERRLAEAPPPGPGPSTEDDRRRLAAARSLVEVREVLGDCTRCKLHSAGRRQIVFGVGNPDAELMFVGEGPGRQEDLQGEPFVGEAGQLLTRIIQDGMKIPRQQVYIANIVKCRPPGNRDPEPDEVEACEPFLRAQIARVQPKVIVALGRYAAQTLLRTRTPIGRLRGRWQRYLDIDLMPTLHPAYLLRNPEAKRPVWEDVKAVMARLEGRG